MKKLVLLLSLIVLSLPVLANHGPAGCGLGTLVIRNPDGLVMHVLQATTNGTSGSATFGMTTGTSNCDLEGGSYAATNFIQSNKVALSNDIAKGKGETVASLANIYGCSATTEFGKKLQKNYRTIFGDKHLEASRINDNIINVIKNDKTLSCKV